jgi:hypothetical protein
MPLLLLLREKQLLYTSVTMECRTCKQQATPFIIISLPIQKFSCGYASDDHFHKEV